MQAFSIQMVLLALCMSRCAAFGLHSIASLSRNVGISPSSSTRAPLLIVSRASNFDTSLSASSVASRTSATKSSLLTKKRNVAPPSDIAAKTEEENTALVWKAIVFGIMTLWGSNFPAIKMIYNDLPSMDSSVYAGWRFGLAALCGVPFFFNKASLDIYKQHPEKLSNIFMKSFGVGLLVFIGYMGQAIGINQGASPENCAFIAALCIAWVPLLTAFLKKDFSKNHWASTLMAVAGVAFLELKGSHGMSAGDLWCFLQPLGFGSSYVLLEYIMNQKGKNEMQASSNNNNSNNNNNNIASIEMEISSEAALVVDDNMNVNDGEIDGEDDLVSALQLAVIGILSVGYAFGTGHGVDEFLAVKDSPSVMGLLAYTGFITTGFTVFLQTKAAKKVASTDFTIILAGEPIFAALFAALFLHEHIGNQDIFGGLLVTIACIANEFDFVSFGKRKKK